MDYGNILKYFQNRYVTLTRDAEAGSREQQEYAEIVSYMDLCKNVTPLLQRAIETQFALASLVPSIEPRTRYLVEEALDQFTHETQLDPVFY